MPQADPDLVSQRLMLISFFVGLTAVALLIWLGH